jgi:CRISPR-associated protein Cas8a1/Csx13
MMNQTQIWRLNDPGLSALHRAGLAGLWMTIDGLLEETRKSRLDWPTWMESPPKLQANSVELTWEGTPRRLLEWLLPNAFRIDESTGLIDLIGMRLPTLEARSAIHQAVLGTFLQHGRTRGAVKGDFTHTFMVDQKTLVLNYAKLQWYSHQKCAEDFVDGDDWAETVPLVGWLAPGGVIRHNAFKETALEEPAQRALLLLFAPIGCFYFNLRSTMHSKKARFALLIPEITNLEDYAYIHHEMHQESDITEMTACGTSDAALRLALLIHGQHRARKILCERCQVITLGTVPWSTQQKTRTAAISVDLRPHELVRDYSVINKALPNKIALSKAKKAEPEKAFIVTSVAREHFGDNLARHRTWYADFTQLMSNSDTRKVIKFEWEGLNMVVNNMELERAEKVVVDACHEALRRRYGQIRDRAKTERAAIGPLFEREYERRRVGLARCKNASALRQELTDFWSRAGQLKSLQEGWDSVRLMFDKEHWAHARDLALLALASYKRPELSDDGQGQKSAADKPKASGS